MAWAPWLVLSARLMKDAATSEPPGDLVLVTLRKLDGKLDRVIEEVTDLKIRVTALEMGLAGVRRDLAALSESGSPNYLRLDRSAFGCGGIWRRVRD